MEMQQCFLLLKKQKKKTILDFSQGIVKNCNVILF